MNMNHGLYRIEWTQGDVEAALIGLDHDGDDAGVLWIAEPIKEEIDENPRDVAGMLVDELCRLIPNSANPRIEEFESILVTWIWQGDEGSWKRVPRIAVTVLIAAKETP